jgi:precorrin-2/cobalt-factor-2 C20-methyltransferase
MSTPGRLYGVGVGPGDPELMTLKAARLLAAAPVVAFFCKKGRRGHGRTIVEGYLNAGVIEEELAYPITTEALPEESGYRDALTGFYDEAAARLAVHLAAGRDVVVISEGDPFFYGSFMPIFHRLAPRFESEIVPGVTGMSGCWAQARTPITYGDDVLTVLPGTLPAEVLKRKLAETDAAVIMKLGRHFAKVRGVLVELGLASRSVYVERGTMAGEKVMALPPADYEGAPYFAMILLPGQGRLL